MNGMAGDGQTGLLLEIVAHDGRALECELIDVRGRRCRFVGDFEVASPTTLNSDDPYQVSAFVPCRVARDARDRAQVRVETAAASVDGETTFLVFASQVIARGALGSVG